MTQTVITLVLVKGNWRLKTPAGTMFDAYFRGDRTDAKAWATAFVSSWYNAVIQFEGDTNEKEDRIPEPPF